MKTTKYKSIFPSVLGDEMDSLFQGFFRPISQYGLTMSGEHLPAVDIDETDSEYFLMAELPGFDKEEIKVSCHDGQLAIEAEHKQTQDKESDNKIIKERRVGRFFRSFRFANNIVENDIAAQYKNGVLELSIPKSAETEDKRRKIEVQ